MGVIESLNIYVFSIVNQDYIILLMKRKSRKPYVSPKTFSIELKTDDVLLVGSNNPLLSTFFFGDVFSTPFDGGGEDW